MSTYLYFSSPIDHHRSSKWDSYGQNLRDQLLLKLDQGLSITVDPIPAQAYGTTFTAGLLRGPTESADIHIDIWSSIVFYASIRLICADHIDPESVISAVPGLTLLQSQTHAPTVRAAKLLVCNEQPSAEVRARLLSQFEAPIYLTMKHCLDDVRLFGDLAPEIVAAFPDDVVAAKVSAAGSDSFWLGSAHSDQGFLTVNRDDPALQSLGEHFLDHSDMEILLARPQTQHPRLASGRCHMDDDFFCIYNPTIQLEIAESLRLII